MSLTVPVNPEFGAQNDANILIDNRDETRLNNKVELQDGRELLKRTCFGAAGNAEEITYGLLSGSAKFDGYMAPSHAIVSAQMATFLGQNRKKHFLMVGPSGLRVGREACFCETKASDYDVDQTSSGLTTAATAFATSQNGIIDGYCLHAAHGATVINANEKASLIFSGASIYQFFALQIEGTNTQTSNFELTQFANDAAMGTWLKAQLETIYPGRTITISGTLTGVNTKSGTLTIEWDGAVGVAGLEVISGAVQHPLVVGGDGGNYNINGGANFALGISQANFQINQRNLGGSHSNVVAIGSSSAPTSGVNRLLNATVVVAPTNTTGAANMVDGNESTQGHLTRDGGSDFLIFDMGAAYNIRGVRVNRATACYLNIEFSTTSDRSGMIGGTTFETASGAATNTVSYDNVRSIIVYTGSPGAQGDIIELQAFDDTVSGPGSLDYQLYYPIGVTPGAASKTGTGATNTQTVAANSLATEISALTTQQGGTTGLAYNVVSADGQDVWVDGEATAPQVEALLSVLSLSGAGATLTVYIDHADDNGSGAPGGSSVAVSFTAVTLDGSVELKRLFNTPFKRWRRVRWTLAGTTPVAVFAVAASA